jgi:peroxiredoxin
MKYLKLPLQALLVMFLLAACSSKKQAEAGKPADSGASTGTVSAKHSAPMAPAFALENAEGKSVALADFKGKVIILNFWATWCGPCRHEIPDFIELQKEYGSKGLQIIGVSVDQDGWKVVKPFIAQNGLNYPVLLYTEAVYNAYQQLVSTEEQGAIPCTFIIGKDGVIVKHLVGSANRATFEGMIKPLLAG